MQFIGKVVTLTATAAAIWDHERYATSLEIQADPANSHAFYVGDENLTTATGRYVGVPATSVPPEPFRLEGTPEQPIDLSKVYVVGTAAEKARVFVLAL